MDHFSTVLALLRAALKEPNPAVLSHAHRLMETLRSEGSRDQAELITKLLDGGAQAGRLEPSRVVLSRAALPGEAMTPSVKPPVDKETGTALADVQMPSSSAVVAAPVLNGLLAASIAALINEWTNIEKLRALGIRPPLNALLYGAPGTGKTRLSHFVAQQVGLPLVTAKLDGLISSFLGTTARNISTLFSFANRYQCVLLLDEFDAIAKVRDDPHEIGEIKRVVNTLLQCLDARSNIGITIAITNHEQLLDVAIWRRFDARIAVPKPDFATRVSIINNFVEPLDLSQPGRRFLAWLADGFSGSDIETLVNAIKRAAALDHETFSLFEMLKRHALLSADQQSRLRWQQLLGPIEDLVAALNEDMELSFTQEELATFFGKDQSTISRWKRKRRVHEVT